jgi:hypothetical protein
MNDDLVQNGKIPLDFEGTLRKRIISVTLADIFVSAIRFAG